MASVAAQRRPASWTEELQGASRLVDLHDTLATMGTKGVDLECHHYNVCITRASQLERANKAAKWGKESLVFYEKMLHDGVAPDVFTFSAAIKAVGKDWRRALSLLDGMPQFGLLPDVFCYTAAVTACKLAGQADAALELHRRMTTTASTVDNKVTCKPNLFTYSPLIACCEQAGYAQAALDLLHEMRQPSSSFSDGGRGGGGGGITLGPGIDPGPFVWASVIGACARAGETDLALLTLTDMRNAGGKGQPQQRRYDPFLDGAAVPVNAAISACAQAGRWQDALALLKAMQGAPSPESSESSAVMGQVLRSGHSGDDDDGGGGGDGGKGKPWPSPDVVSFNAVLSALAKGIGDGGGSNYLRDAAADEVGLLFDDLLALQTSPGGGPRNAGRGANGAVAAPVKPDAISFALAVSALAKMTDKGSPRHLSRALEIVAAMEKDKETGGNAGGGSNARGGAASGVASQGRQAMPPMRPVYVRLIRACEGAGRHEDARDLERRRDRFAPAPAPQQQQQQQQQRNTAAAALPNNRLDSQSQSQSGGKVVGDEGDYSGGGLRGPSGQQQQPQQQPQQQATMAVGGLAAGLGDWVCPSCGWRNRASNALCGGFNNNNDRSGAGGNQRNGAATTKTYGCGAERYEGAEAAAAEAYAALGALQEGQGSQAVDQENDNEEEAGAQNDEAKDGGDEGEEEEAWTVSEGQAVEVWHQGRLVMGNAVLLRDTSSAKKKKKAKKNGESSTKPLPRLGVRVFDPCSMLVGSSAQDDQDGQDGGEDPQLPFERPVVEVALDQLVGAWDITEGIAKDDSLSFYPRTASQWSKTVRDASVLAGRLPSNRGGVRGAGSGQSGEAAVSAATSGRVGEAVWTEAQKAPRRKQQVSSSTSVAAATSSTAAALFLLLGELPTGQPKAVRESLLAEAEGDGDDEQGAAGVFGNVRVKAASHLLGATSLASPWSHFHFKRQVAQVVAEEDTQVGDDNGGDDNGSDARALSALSSSSPSVSPSSPAVSSPSSSTSPSSSVLDSLLSQGGNSKSISKMKATLAALTTTPKAKSTPTSSSNGDVGVASTSPPPLKVLAAVRGGGWRALSPAVALSKQAEAFAALVAARQEETEDGKELVKGVDADGNGNGAEAQFRFLVEELEVFAAGGAAPGPLGRQALQALSRRKKGLNPASKAVNANLARNALVSLGHWTTTTTTSGGTSAAGDEKGPASGGERTPTESSSSTTTTSTWSQDALSAAAEMAAVIGARRQRLAAIAPPKMSSSAPPGSPAPVGFRRVDASVVIAGASDLPQGQRGGGGGDGDEEGEREEDLPAMFEHWPEEWVVGPHGRVDLRGASSPWSSSPSSSSSLSPPSTLVPLCVDLTRTGVRDDAVSWHQPTHTLLVHSTSHLTTQLNAGSLLDGLAQRRGEAAYLKQGGGSLMLLPPALLSAASLAAGYEAPLHPSTTTTATTTAATTDNSEPPTPSSSSPPPSPAAAHLTANECVTTAFRFAGPLHPSGLPAHTLLGSWTFESVIGPVTSLTFESADAALRTTRQQQTALPTLAEETEPAAKRPRGRPTKAAAAAALEEQLQKQERAASPSVVYESDPACKDPALATLRAIHEATPWINKCLQSRHYKKPTISGQNRRGGQKEGDDGARELVALCLTLFSEEAKACCLANSVAVPQTWPGATRFATAPLRRYADILAQRQLLSVLRGTQPMSARKVREAMGDIQRASTSKAAREERKRHAP